MKKPLLLLSAAALLLSSCEKKENTIVNTGSIEDSTYIINGLSNRNIGRVDGAVMPLELVYNTGKQENIELSATELPEGMEVIFEPKSGIPGFNSTMRIESSLTKAGTYPIKINGVSTSGNVKTYTIDITVRDNFNCDSLLMRNIGTFHTRNEPREDTVYTGTYLSTQVAINGNFSKSLSFFFQNLYLETKGNTIITTGSNNGQSNIVRVAFDCSTHTFTIPETEVYGYNYPFGGNQYTVSGTGVINFKNKMTKINYQVKTPDNAVWNYSMSSKLRLTYY